MVAGDHPPPSVARRLSGLVAPPRCAVCGAPCAGASVLCAGCALELGSDPAATGAPLPPPASVPAPPGVELLVAAWPFEGAARGLVHGLKFGRRLSLARVAAARIASLAEGLEGDLVPVPPSPMRRAWRGFDPAEEIALALAPLLGLPLRRCLRRGHGPRQVGRPRRVRLADPP
ncbi:MAG: hypothetical protein FJW90_12445, partial [Actinobacteria bacterium]|nr:hypothetical protein [Actinomycetota bacterium]